MSNQEELVNELKASVDQDLKKRQKSIEDGEALDKVIHQQMDAGEIGISHGTDNHVSVIMLGLATVTSPTENREVAFQPNMPLPTQLGQMGHECRVRKARSAKKVTTRGTSPV